MKLRTALLAAMVFGYALVPVAHAEQPDGGRRLQALEEAPKQEKKSKSKKLTDSQIRKILIDESIAAYSGNCPCPYSRASNGSRCGRRSAHSRAGGEAPLCFDSDVSKEMVRAYRDEHAEE
jgi:hypothetical protein